MLSKKIKDIKIRKLFLKKESIKKINKFLFVHLSSKNQKENVNCFDKNLLKLNSSLRVSKTLIKNRCILTNRNKGVNKHFSISRIVMRDLSQFGLLPGFNKAVW
jgi:ribosomal protein S14